MIVTDFKKVITDYQWVTKVLESSTNENHMKVALKCFSLWESKYNNSNLSKIDSRLLTNLKSDFWSLYNEKNTIVGLISV
jgi:hypothetical protein